MLIILVPTKTFYCFKDARASSDLLPIQVLTLGFTFIQLYYFSFSQFP